MRLPKEMIKHIADAIAANLESKGLVEYEVPKSEIADKIAEVITADMMAEEALNKDVEKTPFRARGRDRQGKYGLPQGVRYDQAEAREGTRNRSVTKLRPDKLNATPFLTG